MNIGIDAHMLGHHETGNETYIFELVQALTEQDQIDQFIVYVEQPGVISTEVTRRADLLVVKDWTAAPPETLQNHIFPVISASQVELGTGATP